MQSVLRQASWDMNVCQHSNCWVIHVRLTLPGVLVGSGPPGAVVVMILVDVRVAVIVWVCVWVYVTPGFSPPLPPPPFPTLSLCWAPANSPTKIELSKSSTSPAMRRTLVNGVKGSWTTDVRRWAKEGWAFPLGASCPLSGSRRRGADSAAISHLSIWHVLPWSELAAYLGQCPP